MNTGPRVATQALRPGRDPTHAAATPAAPGTCVRVRHVVHHNVEWARVRCVCVCVCVCVCEREREREREREHACMHGSMNACTHGFMQVCKMHERTHARSHARTHACMHARMYTHDHTHQASSAAGTMTLPCHHTACDTRTRILSCMYACTHRHHVCTHVYS